jgi:maltoporin
MLGGRPFIRHSRCAWSARSALFGAALLATSRAEAQQPPVPAAAPTPAESETAEKIDKFAARTYENDTETRSRALKLERRALANRFEQMLGNFVDIGGYFRAGYGLDSRGSPLSPFQAPGAGSKYRLGNEAENYGELIIGKNVYLPGAFRLSEDLRPDGTPSGPIARVQVRLSMSSPYATLGTSSGTTFGLPEAWASIGNVFAGQPGAKFWAGRRFYRRHDINIINFYFWQMTAGGGGIEDVQLGAAKVALSWMGFGSVSGLSDVPAPDPENAAGFSKSTIDLRAYDMPMFGGRAEVGLTFATIRSGLDQSGQKAPSTEGMAFNFVHTLTRFIHPDGANKLSIQYGTGPAKTFNAGFESVVLPQGTFIRSEEAGSWRARVTEHFIASLSEHFSLGPALVFEATDHADGTGRQYWISAGLRPIAHVNQYFSVAMEGGVDWVRDTGAHTSGALAKLTLAPQISAGNRFTSRPAIRAFVTVASWSEDFRGKIGGANYANSLSGLNAGMQMEASW